MHLSQAHAVSHSQAWIGVTHDISMLEYTHIASPNISVPPFRAAKTDDASAEGVSLHNAETEMVQDAFHLLPGPDSCKPSKVTAGALLAHSTPCDPPKPLPSNVLDLE
jgi:hypothetical protein